MSIAPLWITSATSIVAIGTSLFLLRQGQQDRREVRRELGRAQAGKVSWWTGWSDPEFGRSDERRARVWVGNSSDQAIYDVFVDMRDPMTGAEQRHILGDIAPQSTTHVDVEVPANWMNDRWEPGALFPRAYFRDAQVQRWFRDSAGRLRPDNEDGLRWNTLDTENHHPSWWRFWQRHYYL